MADAEVNTINLGDPQIPRLSISVSESFYRSRSDTEVLGVDEHTARQPICGGDSMPLARTVEDLEGSFQRNTRSARFGFPRDAIEWANCRPVTETALTGHDLYRSSQVSMTSVRSNVAMHRGATPPSCADNGEGNLHVRSNGWVERGAQEPSIGHPRVAGSGRQIPMVGSRSYIQSASGLSRIGRLSWTWTRVGRTAETRNTVEPILETAWRSVRIHGYLMVRQCITLDIAHVRVNIHRVAPGLTGHQGWGAGGTQNDSVSYDPSMAADSLRESSSLAARRGRRPLYICADLCQSGIAHSGMAIPVLAFST